MRTLTKSLLVAVGGLILSAGAALARPAVVETDLNLRVGASLYAPVIIVLPRGATVEIDDCRGDWCVVIWRGYEGYASASYLSPLGYAPPAYYAPSPPPPSYYGGYYAPRYYYDDDDDHRDRARRKRDRDDDNDRHRSRDRDDDHKRKAKDRDRDDDRDKDRHARDRDKDGELHPDVESLRKRGLYFGGDRNDKDRD